MRFTGRVYRAHSPRWSFAPLSGEGAARYGGRFNPKGMAALYTSTSVETAWREAQQAFVFKAQPMTICAYDVDCEDVADLNEPAGRSALDIGLPELGGDWEDRMSRGLTPPSWLLARRLAEAGTAAIVVPSFAPGALASDRNVVFWRWSDAPPHQVRVIDHAGRLPRDGRSWGR